MVLLFFQWSTHRELALNPEEWFSCGIQYKAAGNETTIKYTIILYSKPCNVMEGRLPLHFFFMIYDILKCGTAVNICAE